MLGGGKRGERIELECPVCGDRVMATLEEAEKGKVRCSRGHEFAVMGMLGGPGRDPGTGPTRH
jgi:hypothetical protein